MHEKLDVGIIKLALESHGKHGIRPCNLISRIQDMTHRYIKYQEVYYLLRKLDADGEAEKRGCLWYLTSKG